MEKELEQQVIKTNEKNGDALISIGGVEFVVENCKNGEDDELLTNDPEYKEE